MELTVQSFVDPDPFQELTFPTVIAAKLASADYLGQPLAKLTPEQMADIDAILGNTLNKQAVMSQIRDWTAEVRSFLQGQLPTSRTQDLREQLLKIGIPL
ncbi:hypothetical protein [Fischerella sp. PCC 9605]|uniref:hypothetical protein n=1 Tax=Fischerella sp. PCC 9605 TaxID=1173024 RepID=UPI00047E1027|nr:hypothetical protein [Fischerella sp. PCC 9605]